MFAYLFTKRSTRLLAEIRRGLFPGYNVTAEEQNTFTGKCDRPRGACERESTDKFDQKTPTAARAARLRLANFSRRPVSASAAVAPASRGNCGALAYTRHVHRASSCRLGCFLPCSQSFTRCRLTPISLAAAPCCPRSALKGLKLNLVRDYPEGQRPISSGRACFSIPARTRAKTNKDYRSDSPFADSPSKADF